MATSNDSYLRYLARGKLKMLSTPLSSDERHPDNPQRKILVAANCGDARLLNDVLQDMDADERIKMLETMKMLGKHSTPLIIAAQNGHLDCVKMLLRYKANIEGRGWLRGPFSGENSFTNTPMFVAAAGGHVDVLNCLVENGANIEARTDNGTALMIVCRNGHLNALAFLLEHGAHMDVQDKQGNTALHHAVLGNSLKVVHKLLSLGATMLRNKQHLKPLRLASSRCLINMVEGLIKRSEFTKEEKVDALELLGASLAFPTFDNASEREPEFMNRGRFDIGDRGRRAFEYMKRGMEQRFKDPSNILFKQAMEPVKAYQNRKESETLEELAQIEGDVDATCMESLIIRERILGEHDTELLRPIQYLANYHNNRENFDVCIALHKHAIEIAQCCNQSITLHLSDSIRVLDKMVHRNFLPRKHTVLELLEQTTLEFEKQKTLKTELDPPSIEHFRDYGLFDCFVRLLQFLAKDELCQDNENSSPTLLLQKLSSLNPRDDQGNSLLHLAAESRSRFSFISPPFEFPCAKTVKLLLNAGFSVNAVNNNGDTPLHMTAGSFPPTSLEIEHAHALDGQAAAVQPGSDKCYILINMLEVLLDEGAHHDFVNCGGKTALEEAQTDEARMILSARGTRLELKCLAAKAVKQFGLPYVGVVPKTLETFISMH